MNQPYLKNKVSLHKIHDHQVLQTMINQSLNSGSKAQTSRIISLVQLRMHLTRRNSIKNLVVMSISTMSFNKPQPSSSQLLCRQHLLDLLVRLRLSCHRWVSISVEPLLELKYKMLYKINIILVKRVIRKSRVWKNVVLWEESGSL